MENKTEPIEAITDEQVLVNKDVYEAYRKLYNVVCDFTSDAQSPIWSINHLLFYWLTTSANLTHGYYDPKFLKSILSTVTFIYDIDRGVQAIEFYQDEASKQKEVSHE